jgi:sigma-B regulation protein RsbU (phosphoserine phosphatase)
MTMTRGMLRAEMLNRNTPAKVLQHLNRVIFSDLEIAHRFVTLFYSEYDPSTKILYFSNAAHNPPLLWQAATGQIIRLDTDGVVIGLEPHSNYEDGQIQLASGDRLLYYTDGITEAANQHGDRFEEDNLIRILEYSCLHKNRPQAILDILFEEIEAFVGLDNPNTDDMTVVVMQVE